MSRTRKVRVSQSELIGLKAFVVDSSNRTQVGINGFVTNETRNTLTIKTFRGNKVIGKQDACFAFQLEDGSTFTIKGVEILARPHERIARNIKRG
ncbi:MAG: ribonuclease P protein subunit [Candidatus Bathyarchaeia archaeon]